MSSTGEPETVESQVDEEYYERLWKIKGLPSAVENPGVKLVKPLEIETSADSPLHSKWIITIGRGYDENEMSIVCTLKTMFNEDIIAVQVQLASGFRSGSNPGGVGNGCLVIEPKERISLAWYKPKKEQWNWNEYLDANGDAIVYVKLTLFNARTPEKMKSKLKYQLVVNARKNVMSLLSGGHTEIDLKIVCSDGKDVKCHKELLKVSSPVFKTMLESGFFEGTSGIINISDISGVTMEILVRFMYTGRLPETWRQPEITLELTYAAGKYQMKALLEYLDNVLGSIPRNSEWPFIFLLKNLVGKLSLKKAEAKLTKRILKRTLSISTTDDIVAVFGNQY